MATDRIFSSRFSVSERRATLVGRAAEMRELERAYALAVEKGQAQTTTVVGVAGVGKTRLVRDFLVRAREGGRAPRVFRGTAREGGPAYEVFARVLRARFGIVEGMDPSAANAQVRAQLASVLDDRKVGDVAYFLGQLLDLDFQRSPIIKAVEADPLQVRTMRRAVIKSFLEADAFKGGDPPVLVFDDLQWSHDDSLELLEALIDTLRAPILFVCVARPQMLVRREGWRRHGGGRHAVTDLSPLSDVDSAAVMHDLLSPCGEPQEIDRLVDEAVLMAGGNPALLEEILRVYHETGVLEATSEFEEERWIIHPDRLARVKLPLSVEDAVQARIGALAAEERELIEPAAAMGGVFWLGGLLATRRQGTSPREEWAGGESADAQRVRQVLADLVDRDYVLRLPDSTFSGDEEYVFKHNLEREAVERLTPPASARRYHRAIADWLAFRENVDTSEEYLEMLARHREKADGSTALAAQSYVKAGDVARSRYANAKAAELYAKGLGLIEKCDHADEELRLRALHNDGDVLQSLGRNDEALRAFGEMLTRAWRLDLRSKGGAAHSRIGRLYRETGQLEEASRHLSAALALFGQSHDERGVGSTLDDIGKLHWLKGDYALALEYTLRGLAMRRKMGDRRSLSLSLNNLGLVQQDSGNTKAALEAFEQALRIRRDIGDLVGVCITLNNLGTVAQDMRDDKKALALFQEAYAIAKETNDRNRIALILTNVGETHNRLGDSARAVTMLKQAEQVADELGDNLGLAEAARGLAKAYLAQREHTKARECAQRAVDILSKTGSKVQLGIALRTLGQVTIAASAGGAGTREATEQLERSIAIFEEIGNDAELARSCSAYAELLSGTPEHATDPAVADEAQRLVHRADEILAKMRTQAAAKEREPAADPQGVS
ncbi:MAG: tetratricopeptide repeat protein [Myxococcota bacterium]|nr:tetratricopeptide repeat protein [Myxococcota bacterium]